MATALRCAECGTTIVPSSKLTFKGKTYCPKCYNKAIKEAESAEQELEELVEFIKELFGLTEFPPEWLEQIQAYHKEKKTLRGMQATLYYYYMILGNIPDVERGLWAIKFYYESASNYFKEKKELAKKNSEVDLTPVKRTIIMAPPQNQTRKPKFNIEDL